MTSSRVFHRTLIAACCGAALSPAFAQSAAASAGAASAADLQRVEVTGSRLKQIDKEGVSPVQTITREDITRTGATTVREMLDSLSATSTGGTLDDIGGSNSFASGASGASLRNLGKQSTLILLNGRRLPAFPLADYSEVFTNVDSLPLGVIERIEVLKSGGSAVYGTDAVAGVINIITRDNYQGAQVDWSGQKSLKNGHFGDRSGGVTIGFGDYASDGYNVTGNIEMYSRDELMWNRVEKDVNPAYAAHSASFGTGSTYAYPGNVVSSTSVPSYALPGCVGVVTGGLCRYDRYSRFEAVPATKRINLFVSGKKRLSDNLEWFSELTYSDIKVGYQSAYAIYGGESAGFTNWGDPTTGAPKTFYYRDIPATNPVNTTGAPADFRYRFVDGPSYQNTNSTQYRLLTGLKGNAGTIDWESAVGVMGGSTHNTERGAFSDSGFKTEIGDYGQPDQNGLLPDVPANFFNIPGGYKIGGNNSASVLNTLFPTYGYEAKDQTYFWDATMRTDLWKLPAGNVQLATGFDLRHEQMTITPSANLQSGDIVGYGTSQSDASRNFGALYAEAGIPIAKSLDGDIAARLDKFPGFAMHVSPKIGLKFKPIEQALFRGTFETGFRAPNLTESAKSTKFAFSPGVDDPKRCDQALNYANDLYDAGAALADSDPNQALYEARAQTIYDNECGRSVAEKTLNNPALKPETSKSFSLGTVLQATSLWSVSVDYWNIQRKNEIGTKSVQDLLAAESSQPAGTVVRQTSFANDPTFSHDPRGIADAAIRSQYGVDAGDYYLTSINGSFQNLGKTKTDGVDVGVKGSMPTRFGDFGLEVDGTYTHSYRVFSETLNGYGDNLAGRYSIPKFVVNTILSYKAGAFDQSLRYVFNSSTPLKYDFDDTTWDTDGCANNGLSPDECRIHTYHRLDYNITWSGIKNLTVGFYVRNVLQHRPPVDYRAFGAPSGVIPISNEDAQGRMGKISISYKFL